MSASETANTRHDGVCAIIDGKAQSDQLDWSSLDHSHMITDVFLTIKNWWNCVAHLTGMGTIKLGGNILLLSHSHLRGTWNGSTSFGDPIHALPTRSTTRIDRLSYNGRPVDSERS